MITKLAEKWRTDVARYSWQKAVNYCADELEVALPTWTRITDDPDTWPEANQTCLFFRQPNSVPQHWGVSIDCYPEGNTEFLHEYDYWRPLCDLDYPPEQES